MVANSYQQSLLSCCQIAEQALSQELLWSLGSCSVSYRLHLATLQLLRADYCSAATSLREAMSDSNQVLPPHDWLSKDWLEDVTCRLSASRPIWC